MADAASTAQIAAQAAQIQAGAQRLAATAGNGFHIEPAAAATLIRSCMASLDRLNGLERYLMTTDPQGMIPAVQHLRRTMTSMIAAYHRASTNHAETEAMIRNRSVETYVPIP